MPLRRWLATMALGLLVACQTPAQTPPPSQAQTTAGPTSATSPAASVAPAIAPPPASASRVETLAAADAASDSGDLKAAAGLYERVVNTPPTAGEAGAASAAITDLADFRAMVTLLADGREDDARAHLDALQQRDPSSPFARLSSQLWDQYGMTGQLSTACAQLQPQIAAQAGGVLGTLQGLGVRVDPASLCRAL